jgi:hypothetical protein
LKCFIVFEAIVAMRKAQLVVRMKFFEYSNCTEQQRIVEGRPRADALSAQRVLVLHDVR